MKKTNVFLSLIMVVLLTFVCFASGCGIDENTKPEDIVSDKVTEEEWKSAFAYVGVRESYDITTAKDDILKECSSVAIRMQMVFNYNDGQSDGGYGIIKYQRTFLTVPSKIDGKEEDEYLLYKMKTVEETVRIDGVKRVSSEYSEESDAFSVGVIPAKYSALGLLLRGESFEFDRILSAYADFKYNEEDKAYNAEMLDGITKVRFKEKKIVCVEYISESGYGKGSISIIFYDYNKTVPEP